MINIELKNQIERKHEDDKKRKTVILGEAENGWILVKRIEKKNEEGYVDPENCEETVLVYRENPLNMTKDEEEFSMQDAVSQMVDKLG